MVMYTALLTLEHHIDRDATWLVNHHPCWYSWQILENVCVCAIITVTSVPSSSGQLTLMHTCSEMSDPGVRSVESGISFWPEAEQLHLCTHVHLSNFWHNSNLSSFIYSYINCLGGGRSQHNPLQHPYRWAIITVIITGSILYHPITMYSLFLCPLTTPCCTAQTPLS